MGLKPSHIRGTTFHGRKGTVANAFRYGVDYVLVEPEADQQTPWLFSRNRRNLCTLHDKDHGGDRSAGEGAAWVRRILASRGLDALKNARVELLAQPRILGHVFNPVSFWLISTGDDLRAVIAEVNNTYGDRHSYLCHHADLRPIQPTDRLRAKKIFYVSPFQPVSGEYVFRFDVGGPRIGIVIDYKSDAGGLFATFHGKRAPLTSVSILGAALRRPVGSWRVLGLIHWQALRLRWKGVPFRPHPPAPRKEIS